MAKNTSNENVFEPRYTSTNILNKGDVLTAMSKIEKAATKAFLELPEDSQERINASHNQANINNYKNSAVNEHNTIEQDIELINKAELQLFYITNP